MARRIDPDTLIHCDACGEDYSATYKRCPFCGARRQYDRPASQEEPDDEDGYVFDGQDVFDDDPEPPAARTHAKGGKRLADRSGSNTGSSRRSRQSDDQEDGAPPPINWPRLITFICSIIIILAALVIVFTVIYPQLRQDPESAASASVSSDAPSAPVESLAPVQESQEPEPGASQDAASPALISLTLDTYDFTLWPDGDSHTLKVTTDPADWEGEITFTSKDESIATVDATGKVVNTNSTTSLLRTIITVSAGGQSVECVVFCRGTSSGASAPPVVVTSSPDPATSAAPSGELTLGAEGTIINAEGGLRVRSGPGTSYEVLASLANGNTVTVLADAGGGWYQISYRGSGGSAETGYIMGDYISQ